MFLLFAPGFVGTSTNQPKAQTNNDQKQQEQQLHSSDQHHSNMQ